jgi:hypothetical protein
MNVAMIDGKVCTVVSENRASQRCYICNAAPKIINDLTKIYSRPSKTEYFAFGLSPLHTKIRTFECLLHVAYNLKFDKGDVRAQANKVVRTETKAAIQDDFRQID